MSDFRDIQKEALEKGILLDKCGLTERYYDFGLHQDFCGMSPDEILENMQNAGCPCGGGDEPETSRILQIKTYKDGQHTSTTNEEHEINSEVTVRVPAIEGCNFSYWELNETTGETKTINFIMPEEDVVLSFYYEIEVHTVTLSGEHIQNFEGQGTYKHNSSVTISATPESGYVFTKWSDENKNNPRNITVNMDINLTAYTSVVTTDLAYWGHIYTRDFDELGMSFGSSELKAKLIPNDDDTAQAGIDGSVIDFNVETATTYFFEPTSSDKDAYEAYYGSDLEPEEAERFQNYLLDNHSVYWIFVIPTPYLSGLEISDDYNTVLNEKQLSKESGYLIDNKEYTIVKIKAVDRDGNNNHHIEDGDGTTYPIPAEYWGVDLDPKRKESDIHIIIENK